eukprot:scaffold21778_cov131-Isochrysis_galbana.AAC.17
MVALILRISSSSLKLSTATSHEYGTSCRYPSKMASRTISAAKKRSGRSVSWSFGKKGACTGRQARMRASRLSVPWPVSAEMGRTDASGKRRRQCSSSSSSVPSRASVAGGSGVPSLSRSTLLSRTISGHA